MAIFSLGWLLWRDFCEAWLKLSLFFADGCAMCMCPLKGHPKNHPQLVAFWRKLRAESASRGRQNPPAKSRHSTSSIHMPFPGPHHIGPARVKTLKRGFGKYITACVKVVYLSKVCAERQLFLVFFFFQGGGTTSPLPSSSRRITWRSWGGPAVTNGKGDNECYAMPAPTMA